MTYGPEAIARQLDRCDICGRKVHKKDLVRTNVDFLAPEATNYFNHSSYNATSWDTSVWAGVTDSGNISTGPYADRSRVVISDDNTRTESFGTQTWTVGNPGGPYSGVLILRSHVIDMSSWDSFVVSFDFGFQDQDTSDKKIMVYTLIRDDQSYTGGNASGIHRRFQGYYSSGRYWWYSKTADINGIPSNVVDLSSAYFFIGIGTYTGGEKVWVDRMQLEKNASKMGAFAPTTGASVDRTDSRMMTVRKVCANCREPLLSRSEQHNRKPEKRTDDPISIDLQEV
jgi:hypothetical protein